MRHCECHLPAQLPQDAHDEFSLNPNRNTYKIRALYSIYSIYIHVLFLFRFVLGNFARDLRNLFIEHLTLSMFWLEIASKKFLFQFTIVQCTYTYADDCARAGRTLKISKNSAKNSLVNIF